MRKAVKGLIRFLARNRITWTILNPTFLRVARSIDAERKLYLEGEPPVDVQIAIHQHFPDLVVKHGPFQGLRYPLAKAAGSLIFPKLLGSYERELQDIIEQQIRLGFKRVIDIGCAEGYYAIGLARRLPDAEIVAFDINPDAQLLCRKMQSLNEVGSRMDVRGECTRNSLEQLLSQVESTLILCDCEGYEKVLFDRELIPSLRRHTLLIETHDVFDLSITPHLKSLFCETHRIDSIVSVDDVQKVHEYQYPELQSYSLEARFLLLAEYRKSAMEWLLISPK